MPSYSQRYFYFGPKLRDPVQHCTPILLPRPLILLHLKAVTGPQSSGSPTFYYLLLPRAPPPSPPPQFEIWPIWQCVSTLFWSNRSSSSQEPISLGPLVVKRQSEDEIYPSHAWAGEVLAQTLNPKDSGSVQLWHRCQVCPRLKGAVWGCNLSPPLPGTRFMIRR